MTKKEWNEYIAHKNMIYLDGATGSNLMKAGMPSGVCPEKWILEHRDVMLSLQKQYVAAGTDILYSPTFTANRIKLKEYGLEQNMEAMIRNLVGISKEAAASACPGRRVLIAGDLTMTGQQLAPMGTLTLEELIDVYKEQIRLMEEAGVDLIVVETMMSLQETRAALIAAKEVSNIALITTLTFERDGRTLFGTDGITAAVCLEALGACAVGANCSTGPAAMEQLIRDMAENTAIPIIAKPNAGLPSVDADGNTYYDMDAVTFAEEMKILVNAGASILGGCCGTTPDYIRLLKEETKDLVPARKKKDPGLRYLTSERQTLSFGLKDGFIFVGERINPTGKKALQAQLREGSFDLVTRFAEEQEACGAQILDVNMGMSGIDEKEMMLQALSEVSGVTSLPLSLDSSHIDVLEAALRQYPGRALINSISLESEKFEKLIPIAAKYGAMFILLPLSDKGLPENLEEKKQIIHTIMDRAFSYGMTKQDIIVDGLVTTIGANKNAALETLETIRYCYENDLATTCGLSNISFGMPERSYVNTAFLTMAIQSGLTMAIANPSQEMLVSCALGADLLLHKEDADIRYIEYAERVKENREKKEAAQKALLADAKAFQEKNPSKGDESVSKAQEGSVASSVKDSVCKAASRSPIQEELYQAVMKGKRKEIQNITRNALAQREDPSVLLNQILLPAINEVGELFDKGKYFLPQLISSAESMKSAIEILEPLLLQNTDTENMPTVVIATVEGDIHDIGKNLVGLMLKNYGFRVVDLGKDVPASVIIEAAKKEHAQLIGLSALMTTTMQRMKEVVDLVHKEGLPVKIFIGGAVITQEYADEIGADAYSSDAADAVRVAKRLLKN